MLIIGTVLATVWVIGFLGLMYNDLFEDHHRRMALWVFSGLLAASAVAAIMWGVG